MSKVQQVAGQAKAYRPKVKVLSAKFTEEQTKLLTQLFNEVWQYIGSDLESSMAEAGERLTNDIVIETILDADRPTEYIKNHYRNDGGKMAETYALFHDMRYPTRVEWVKKNCGRFV